MFVEDPHNTATGRDAKVELPAPVLALRDALDDLQALDCAALSAGEVRATVVELCAAASRLEAVRLDAVADLDQSLAWVGAGALTAGSWLGRHTPLDAAAGRRDARVAKRLRQTPGTRAALAEGTLSPGAAAVIADGVSADPVAFEQIEDSIVEAAKTCERSKLKQALKLWDELVRGEDRVGADLERQHRRRGVSVSQTLDGVVVLDGTFDPVDGAELIAVLHTMEQHLFHHDREHGDLETRTPLQRRADALMDLLRAGAASMARGDEGPAVPGCATSTTIIIRGEHLTGLNNLLRAAAHYAQQQTQAETNDDHDESDVGMARDDATTTPSPEPEAENDDECEAQTAHDQATTTPSPDPEPDAADPRATQPNTRSAPNTSTGTTAPERTAGAGLTLPPPATPFSDPEPATSAIPISLNGRDHILDPGTLDYLLCDTKLAALIVGPHDVPLNLGREHRTATRAQRNALRVRDKHCIFPGCDRPPHWCDAHHITYWDNGGHTDLRNLALLCRAHHRLIHKPDWGVQIDNDNLPTITYHGTPQPRNTHPPPWPAAA